MRRRLLLPAALIALVACGRDAVSDSSSSEPPAGGTETPATAPPNTGAPGTATGTAAPGTGAPEPGAIAHPTGADEAIVRLNLAGGFAPEGADFQRPPDLLILGDGTVIRPGPQIEIFPPPLLPSLTVAKLDEEGIQTVLEAADDADLLATPPAYDIPPGAGQVTDAPGTTLEIHAGRQDLTHTAYALGIGPDGATESTSARRKLNAAVTELRDLSSLVGAHLGAEQQYEPTRFGVIARPATPEELAPAEDGSAPTPVPWPGAAGNLADAAGTCVEVAPDAVRDAFTSANQLTRFAQAGVTYVVYVRVLLPDESCAQFA